jgi:protein SCO1/2
MRACQTRRIMASDHTKDLTRGSSLLPRLSKSNLFGLWILLLCAFLVILSYQSWKRAETKSSAVLQRLNKIPDFALVDQDGRAFGTNDLKGKIWVADFICTRYAGPYPLMSSHFAELDRNFGKSDALNLVTFTVDPEYDIPTVLKRYSQQYEASARWHFLTGDKKRIVDLATTGFRVETQGTGTGLDHLQTMTFVLVDGDGTIRSYYDGSSVEVVQRLLTDLGSLLRGSAK